jgi:hypothetical protein
MYILYKAGQYLSLGLYAMFGARAVFKKRPLLLVTLFLAHLGEYFWKAREIAEEKGIEQPEALKNTLLYGVAWWYPAQNGEQDI